MHMNFSLVRRFVAIPACLAALSLATACGSSGGAEGGGAHDSSADSAGDTLGDGSSKLDTGSADTLGQDAKTGPALLIDSPKPGAVLSGGGAFTLQAHVQDPPTSGGPFTLSVSDAVSAYVVATATTDDLVKPLEVSVNLAGLPGGSYALRVSVHDAKAALVATADLVFVVNAPPSAPAVAIAPEHPTAADGFAVQLTTASTDPEGDAITYSYAWTRNGVPTNDASSSIPASATKKNEVWVVAVTPADAYGKGWAGSAYVVIANQAPVAATLASAVTVVDLEGEISASTAQAASDPDGDALLLTWQWSLGTKLLPGLNKAQVTAGEIAAADKALAVGDEISLVQTAFDGQATTTSAPLTWKVANFLPHLIIDSPAQNAVLTSGAPFTIAAHVENAPTTGAPFQLVVSDAVSGQVVAKASLKWLTSALSIVVDLGGIPDGTYALQLALWNGNEALVASSAFVFTANAPPSVPQVAITPQLATAQDELKANILVAATDPEGDALSYSYAWLRNGLATTFTGASVPAGTAKKGELWTVLVSASDAYGSSWPATADLQIGNIAPGAAILSADTQVVGLLGEVSATAATAASDADQDALTISWHWAVNGVAVPGKNAASSTLLGLRNALGATIKAGDVITVAATADDGTAVALSNELTWTVQGGANVCASRPVCGIDATCANNDSLDPTCTCKATTIGDGQFCVLVTGLSPTVSTFVLADGTTSFSVGGNANVPGLVVVEVFDTATGNKLSGTTIPGLGGASAIKAISPVVGNGKVTVRISRNGVQLGEKTYEIALNHKPTAPQGALSPAAPDTTQAVSYAVSVTSTDADAGQTISYKYAWSINSTVTTALTGTSVPAGTAKKGDKLTLKVTPNDGLENGPALTLNVTIANAAPSAFSGSYSTQTPNTASQVTVNLSNPPTTDPDGEAVSYSYQWFVNDAVLSGATAATLDLATQQVLPGATLRAEVTATDGTATTKLVLGALTVVGVP